jgi:hypothetical protein
MGVNDTYLVDGFEGVEVECACCFVPGLGKFMEYSEHGNTRGSRSVMGTSSPLLLSFCFGAGMNFSHLFREGFTEPWAVSIKCSKIEHPFRLYRGPRGDGGV